MADLTITAANVKAGSNAKKTTGVAGETITAGQAVYLAAAGKFMKSDADSATVEARAVRGIALHSATLDQPLTVQTKGDINLGATLTVNSAYCLSGATAGGICPPADVGTGEYYVHLGLARTTSILQLDIQSTGVAN